MRYILLLNDLKFAIQAAIGFNNYKTIISMTKASVRQILIPRK